MPSFSLNTALIKINAFAQPYSNTLLQWRWEMGIISLWCNVFCCAEWWMHSYRAGRCANTCQPAAFYISWNHYSLSPHKLQEKCAGPGRFSAPCPAARPDCRKHSFLHPGRAFSRPGPRRARRPEAGSRNCGYLSQKSGLPTIYCYGLMC